jgi:subtilisin family serine protease
MASKRGSPPPAICPSCTFIINPIFSENQLYPTSTPEGLARTIVETIDAGANIINLSVGLSISSIIKYAELEEAIQYAITKNVLLIIASGNQGKIAVAPSFNHANNIIVVACDSIGLPSMDSNLGGKNGLAMGIMAPGVNIVSTVPDKGYLSVSGSSIATPFVTGTIALVSSIFPNLPLPELKCILSETHKKNRTIIPPLLNVESFYDRANEKAKKFY